MPRAKQATKDGTKRRKRRLPSAEAKQDEMESTARSKARSRTKRAKTEASDVWDTVQFVPRVLDAEEAVAPLRSPVSSALRSIYKLDAEQLLQVRPCPGLGHGVFAVRDIPAGQHILEYAGRRKHGVDWSAVETSDARYMWDLGEGEAIDSAAGGNESRFLNHYQSLRSSANVETELVSEADGKHVVFRTASNIRRGEQLVIDYGQYFAGSAAACCVYRHSVESGQSQCVHCETLAMFSDFFARHRRRYPRKGVHCCVCVPALGAWCVAYFRVLFGGLGCVAVAYCL